MKILVVDDCPTVRLRLVKELKTWGFDPVTVEDAFEACALLERDELPRLLIVDWVMPRMEGPELIREIRKHDPDRNKYIIMLTGKSGREVLETAFRCGADDYMSKPIVEEELYRRICEGKNILERHDQVMAASLK
ncbi:MAG: response regulator [Planctomycetota bacterium]